MNYGIYSIEKKQAYLRSKRRRISSFVKVLFLRLFLLGCVIGGFAIVSGAIGIYKGIVSRAPGLEMVSAVPTSGKTSLYYSDGETLIGTISSSDSNRAYITYENISKYAIDAFVVLLDDRFWEHKGVDTQSFFNSLFSKDDSSSSDTITLKLIKNQIFRNSNNLKFTDRLTAKIQEQYLAVRLETYTPKERILEYYLNTINLGNGSYGIQTAARNYFGKNATDLTISEACVLAPIASSPTNMNPLTHPDSNRQMRNETLGLLHTKGLITSEQYEEALSDTENVYLRVADNMQSFLSDDTPETYFTNALITQVLEDLEAKGYSSYEATNLLYGSGLTIYTTQDKEIQAILDEEFTNENNFPELGEGSYYELSDKWSLSIYIGRGNWVHFRISDLLNFYSDYDDQSGMYIHSGDSTLGISALTLNEKDLESKISTFISRMMAQYNGIKYTEAYHVITLQPQASMVVMNPYNGDVLAIYGGRGGRTDGTLINRATEMRRQPGSVLMTLSSFLPALDTGGGTLATVYDDSYMSYEEYSAGKQKTTVVSNWYTTGYEGLSSIRRGIYHSMNTVAAQCFEKIGGGTSLSYLKQLGFTRLSDTADRSMLTALGRLSEGVTLMELVGAYSAIANDGNYNAPRLYTDIYDSDGNLILHKGDEPSQIFKASTAKLLTAAMKDTVNYGTGMRCRFKNLPIDIAGKTGSSTNSNDLWFCGYTPYYCAGIWSGYDSNFTQTATQYQKELWSKVMERIHVRAGKTEGSLALPTDYVECRICSKCGNLAVTDLCDQNEAGNLIVTEYFAPGTEPETTCTCCTRITVCDESGSAASPSCPETHSVVLLSKAESTESLLHGGTKDTPCCLTPEINKTCSIHGTERDNNLQVEQ